MPSSLSSPVDPNILARQLIQRAHNRDGLPEIVLGLGFLLVAGLTYAQVMLPRESMGFKAAVLTLATVFPLLCFGSPWVLRWVRRRYLIGRLGYVQPKPISRKDIGMGVTVAVLMIVALFGIVPRLSQPNRWILAGTGLFGGALAAFSGQLPRFVIGGLLMAATGIGVALSGVSLEAGFAILFGFPGILAVISGVVVFVRFVRGPIDPGE